MSARCTLFSPCKLYKSFNVASCEPFVFAFLRLAKSLFGLDWSRWLLGQRYIVSPKSTIVHLAFDFVHVLSRFLLLYSEKMAWVMIVSSLWMGHAMYFSLGNSNSLASVDISAGYVGLEDFVPSLMLILTYFSTYCGPCLWMFSGVLSVVRNAEDVSR